MRILLIDVRTKKAEILSRNHRRDKIQLWTCWGGSWGERIENWRKHFSGLLGQPPSVPDANMPIRNKHPPLKIDTGPFSFEELQLSKKQIVEGKAHSDDSISPEVMKRTDIDDIIVKFCNDASCDGQIPDQWKLSNIVPVPKKRSLTKIIAVSRHNSHRVKFLIVSFDRTTMKNFRRTQDAYLSNDS